MNEEKREMLLTWPEWDEHLGYGIVDPDGFRDGDITTETTMTKEEFIRRAQRSTRRLVK